MSAPIQDVAAEKAALGAVLVHPRVFADLQKLRRQHFATEVHGAIWEAICAADAAKAPIDAVVVWARMESSGTARLMTAYGGPEYLTQLMAEVVTVENLAWYEKRLMEMERRRLWQATAQRILVRAGDPSVDGAEFLEMAVRESMIAAASDTRDKGVRHVKAVLREAMEEIYRREECAKRGEIDGISSGLGKIDEMTHGFQPGDYVVVAGRPSMGKAQPLDARVRTPTGWKTMGEIRVEDRVSSIDGAPSSVVGVYPQGRKEIYRVTFSDGRTTECCADHLWLVHHRQWVEPRVMTLREISDALRVKRNIGRMWIDVPSGVDAGREPEEMPIDPWLLGAILGDGNVANGQIRFSSKDDEIIARATEAVSDLGMELRPIGGVDFRIVKAGRRNSRVANPLKQLLIEVGAMGSRAHEKRVPRLYLDAGSSVRRAVLRGLLDTDGWVESHGSVRYCTTSRGLALDVVELVRSLGGVCKFGERRPKFSYRGEKKSGRIAYVANISSPDVGSLFSLTRKARATKQPTRTQRVTFSAIEFSRVAEAQCIAVSHPSMLYVTDDYIVTHNTAFMLNLVRNFAFALVPSMTFSAEMRDTALVQRMLSADARVPKSAMRSGSLSRSEWDKLHKSASQLSELPIWTDPRKRISLSEMRSRARRWHAEHIELRCRLCAAQKKPECKHRVVLVDYLQLIKAPVQERQRDSDRVREIANISAEMKDLAMDLELPVIALAQLNRDLEKRPDKRPMMSDLKESGAIEQDADIIMFLYRHHVYYPTKADDTDAEIIFGKQREGETGTVHLHWNGAQQRFSDPGRSLFGEGA